MGKYLLSQLPTSQTTSICEIGIVRALFTSGNNIFTELVLNPFLLLQYEDFLRGLVLKLTLRSFFFHYKQVIISSRRHILHNKYIFINFAKKLVLVVKNNDFF